MPGTRNAGFAVKFGKAGVPARPRQSTIRIRVKVSVTHQFKRHRLKRTCSNSLENIKSGNFLRNTHLFSSLVSIRAVKQCQIQCKAVSPYRDLCFAGPTTSWGTFQDVALLCPDSGPESLFYLHSHHLIGQKISFSANSAKLISEQPVYSPASIRNSDILKGVCEESEV